MLRDKAEAVRAAQALQLIRQLLTQAQHAQTHLFQLGCPIGAQGVVVQDHRHQARAVIRREREVLPVEEGQRALVQRLCAAVLANRHQKAGAFAVDAEILGAACRDQAFGRLGSHHAHTRCVFFQTVAKALVGNVDHRDQTARVQKVDHLLPLGGVQVGPGGIVAAAVQQHHVALLGPFQILDHPVKVHATGFAVEIAIGDGLDANVFQDRDVVRPGRVRHKDACLGVGHLDQLERLAHGTGTAGGGGGGNVSTRHAITQDQFDHDIGITGITREASIGLGGFFFPQLVLGGLDRAHHRGDALGVLVDTDTKVDLIRARVLAVHLHQRQDLVRWLGFQGLEHQFSPVATGRVGKAPHSAQDPS